MPENENCFVHLEIKRIQSYLFSVPKLKAMLGANTILGETLTGSVSDLDTSQPSEQPSKPPENLVQLALSSGLALKEIPEDIKILFVADEYYPDDNPLKFAEKGIISRNGGHFSAFFSDKICAEDFVSKARMLIAEKLPGILIEATLHTFESIAAGEKGLRQAANHPAAVDEIPQFSSCSGSGNEPAAGWINGDAVSQSLSDKTAAADRFYKGEARDVLSKLFTLYENYNTSSEKMHSFEDICEKDYLAVIHADGNSIGELSKSFIESTNENFTANHVLSAGEQFFRDQMIREAFYYRMRKSVRTALMAALNDVYQIEFESEDTYSRFRILMLGGDDLLLVCRAADAFSVIINYAKRIEEQANNNSIELSIGAGLVIAHKDYPFNQLHGLAESLASRAKQMRMYQLKGEKCSVMDWVVSSESLTADLSSITKRHFSYTVNPSEYYLTLRPYRIIGENILSAEFLYTTATTSKGLLSEEVARNQYKRFINALKKGVLEAIADRTLEDARLVPPAGPSR